MEPKTEPRSERILVSITPSMKKRLVRMAEEQFRSLSHMIYLVLREALGEEEDDIQAMETGS